MDRISRTQRIHDDGGKLTAGHMHLSRGVFLGLVRDYSHLFVRRAPGVPCKRQPNRPFLNPPRCSFLPTSTGAYMPEGDRRVPRAHAFSLGRFRGACRHTGWFQRRRPHCRQSACRWLMVSVVAAVQRLSSLWRVGGDPFPRTVKQLNFDRADVLQVGWLCELSTDRRRVAYHDHDAGRLWATRWRRAFLFDAWFRSGSASNS